MPVRVFPAGHRAEVTRWMHDKQDAKGILKGTSRWLYGQNFELYKTSLDDNAINNPNLHMRASKNGFVDAVLEAYGRHHNLIIRPDDVWIAALSQFSLYINAHPEELRRQFVDFDGQRTLTFFSGGTVKDLDYGHLATEFARLIQENVVDPELEEWMMPGFSTSSQHDRIIASMMMMGCVKKFFRYEVMCVCGIPSVTLLGERQDYEKLVAKVARFRRYGPEAVQFADLLEPVIRRMARSFDDPTSEATVGFWQRVASRTGGGCSFEPETLSGWITAFCFWNEEGKCCYDVVEGATYSEEGGEDPPVHRERGRRRSANQKDLFLELDGVRYHHASFSSPPGWCTVPLKINTVDGQGIEAEILAGSTGIALSSSGALDKNNNVGLDTMQPMTAWWLYEKREWRDPREDAVHVWNLMPLWYRDDRWMESRGFRKKQGRPKVSTSANDWEFVGSRSRRPSE